MTRVSGDWLNRPATQRALALLTSAGHQAYLVGGCVRNALLGAPISDIDIATDAHPEKVLQLAANAGLRSIPTGLDHGTVTVMVDGLAHEITTFRKDVATDGRHAEVRFSDSIAEDAQRRDFTVNALYADSEGSVLDPVSGLQDIAARRIRFIGDATTRIAEDYLRILRFFRFHATYGDPAQGLDADGLAACAAGADGLARLSRERVGAEMKKLLGADDPCPSVAAMAQSGILTHVMPGAEPKALGPLVHFEDGLRPDWTRRAAALGGEDVTEHWRLSRTEARALRLLRDLVGSAQPPAEIAYRHDADTALNVELLRAAIFEQPLSAAARDIERGAQAKFPISAADLMPDLSGPALGQKLAELETAWIKSGFTLTRGQLLAL